MRAYIHLFVALLAGCVSPGQTLDTSVLRGHVVDQSQGVIVGAVVSISNMADASVRMVNTDANGDFVLAGLPGGTRYSVTVSKPGFASRRISEIVVGAGATAVLNVKIDVAGARTKVNVTGVPGEVRTDSPQLADHLVSEQIEQVPILNRRTTFLPLLNSANRPAINQGDVFLNQYLFTTNGVGRRQTWFEVDGNTGNDSWGRQTLFTAVPLAAIQETTVLENSFSAEYGSAGSAVNIVTRSGTGRIHAQAIEVFRPSETQSRLSGFTVANAASGNDITSDTLGQTSVSIGGPAVPSGRMHFFAAGEFSRQNRTSPVTSPVAPGIFIGRYRGWLGFLRLDYQLNAGNNIFLRSGFDGFYDTNPNGTVGGNNLPSTGRVFRRRTYSESIGETAVLGLNFLNTVRLQFQLGSPITQFDPAIYDTQYQVPISTGGTFISGTSQSALLLNRQYQATDVISAIRGRHETNFGFSILAAHSGGNSKEFGGPIYLGQLLYNTCVLDLTVCESPTYLNNILNVRTYTQSFGNAEYNVNDVLASIFVQDHYRVRNDLTLNLGLRYERQTFTDFVHGFAPRLGFTYNWLRRNTTVIRAGFGIYYSQIVDNAQANYALTGPTGVFNYTAAPGQIGFPTSVATLPLPTFPAGAPAPLRNIYIRPGSSAYLDQFFATSTLLNYPDKLLNPYTEQWVFGVERKIQNGWVVRLDYVGSHTLRINRPLDVNPPESFIRTAPGQFRSAQAANCSRPYWMWWYSEHGLTCNPARQSAQQPPYSTILSDVNKGYSHYHSLQVNLTGRMGRQLTMLGSYTWSHTTDNVDPDVPGQNPNDARITGRAEYGNAIFDQRHRFVLSGVSVAPWGFHVGGVATMASGLPYNMTTGTNNSGDTGATTDRPVVNGAVVGRNTQRGTAIYDLALFVERPFHITEQIQIEPRVEVFNLLNHPNFVGFSGTYGNGPAPGPGFGQPLAGVTNQLPARSIQFFIKVTI